MRVFKKTPGVDKLGGFAAPIILSLVMTFQLPAAQAAEEEDAVRALITKYFQVLNASDVDGVLALYDEGGIFMPQHSPPQVGKATVRKSYVKVFETIDLQVSPQVLEAKVLGDWAFVITTSSGTLTIKATGQQASEKNQELFLLHKTGGVWKIARYMFTTTSPRPH